MSNTATEGGLLSQMRSQFEGLLNEMKDVRTRSDASIKDFASTVEGLAKTIAEVDKRSSDALDAVSKDMKGATGPDVQVQYDALMAEMRSVVGRIDALDANAQRPQSRDIGAPASLERAISERSADYERFISHGTRNDRFRMAIPRLEDCRAGMRAATWPALGDTEFGPLVQDVYRPGVVSFGYDPIGLWDIIPKMPAFTGDTVRAPRMTAKSDGGFVKNLVNGAINGAGTAVNTVVLDSTAGMFAGGWIRFYTVNTTTLLGRRKITAIASATNLTFGADDIDFDIADNDEALFEGIATTAEGVSKPAGYFGSELLTATSQVIAAWTKLAKQSIATVPGLVGNLQGKMQQRNLESREQHVMYGTGSNGTLNGFMNHGSIATDTWSTALEVGDTEADLIAYSAMQLPSSRPLFSIMNKNDWNALCRRKASDGHYVNTAYGPMRIIDTPTMRAVGSVQVVLARHMLATSALMIDPAGASELYPQAGLAAFEIGYESDDFIKNLVTLLYEEAWAHLILDETLFRALSFDGAPSSV